MTSKKLFWQSKLALLAVLPATAASVVLDSGVYWRLAAPVVLWTLGLSALCGALAIKMRAGAPGGSLAGAVITASLMYSTASYPYSPLRTGLTPVLAFFALTCLATRAGRSRKERLGVAESRRGRNAAQAAANLGVAALASFGTVQSWLLLSGWMLVRPRMLLAVGLAALTEAAADTVSSEIGQAWGGAPRLITTLHRVAPGVDGGVTATGAFAGLLAGALTAAAGAWALRGGWAVFALSLAGGAFGLFFDSLLGATLERRGWLSNDAVNFLSTGSAALFAAALLATAPHLGLLR